MAREGSGSVPEQFVGAYVRILELLCGAEEFRSAAESLLREVSGVTSCEAVGLRVHDRRDDYPYFVYSGFEDAFIEKESGLCHLEPGGRVAREASGRAVLECMCGLVLCARTDSSAPFFTENGSFWTNSTTELLANTTDDGRGTKTRNTCNIWGYESVALVPVRSGEEIVGLIQANSRERGRFYPAIVGFLERVGGLAGRAIETAWRREELDGMARELDDRRRGTEAMVAIGEMAATLAHEVKNPLAGMMLSATRLRKALKGREKFEATVEHLCSAIGALSETVTRVTDSIRGPRIERATVSINDVLESVISLVAPTASSQEVQVVREFAPGLPPVNADASFLRRALMNLFLNALEAMPSGGILRIETRKTDRGEGEGEGEGGVDVVIADTGPGVDPKEAEKLFEPFVSRKPGGTGLGLGIVRRIMELHSGSVSLRPGAGGGTEAVVRLPAEEGPS